MKSVFTFSSLLLAATLSLSQLHAQNIYTFAGNGYGSGSNTGGYGGDNYFAQSAALYNPSGVATHDYSAVFIADQGNHVIRAVNALSTISTYAGKDSAGYGGDGGKAADCILDRPYAIALDGLNNLYIADYNNHVVRKIDVTGNITTIAGSGVAGYSGDGAMATDAKLRYPYGLAVDNFGNVYIADAGNNVIRLVDNAGFIHTFAGNGYGAGLGLGHGGYTGDGGNPRAARLNSPKGVAVDVSGTVYIADSKNNAIRKVSMDTITTLAGIGYSGYTGNGGPAAIAMLNFPSSIAVDGSYNIYFTDQGNNVVRKITPAGIISTIAGNGTSGYSGDGGPAIAAELNSPLGVTVDGAGLIYIADAGNNRIRIVGNYHPNSVSPLNASTFGLSIFPNPSNGTFSVTMPVAVNNGTLTLSDLLGRVVETRTINGNAGADQTVNFTNLASGNYILKLETEGNIYREKVSIK